MPQWWKSGKTIHISLELMTKQRSASYPVSFIIQPFKSIPFPKTMHLFHQLSLNLINCLFWFVLFFKSVIVSNRCFCCSESISNLRPQERFQNNEELETSPGLSSNVLTVYGYKVFRGANLLDQFVLEKEALRQFAHAHFLICSAVYSTFAELSRDVTFQLLKQLSCSPQRDHNNYKTFGVLFVLHRICTVLEILSCKNLSSSSNTAILFRIDMGGVGEKTTK